MGPWSSERLIRASRDSENRISKPTSLARLQLLLEFLNFGLHLLPERFLRCLLTSVDEHRNHLLDSRDIDPGTLGLTALAIGDCPIHNFGLEGILDADEIFAAHLAEWFLSGF